MEENKQAIITIKFSDGSEVNLEYTKDYDTFKIEESGALILSFESRLVAIYATGFWKSVIAHYYE